jgi:hypothetical protein
MLCHVRRETFIPELRDLELKHNLTPQLPRLHPAHTRQDGGRPLR